MKNKFETPQELLEKSEKQVIIVVENVRSAYNVGAMFRTADGAGNIALILTGYTPTPENPKVKKTGLGAEETVPWCHVHDVKDVISFCSEHRYEQAALEITTNAKNLFTWTPEKYPIFLYVGNEVTGVSLDILMNVENAVMLPMNGHKVSLNVAEATSILIYEMLRKTQP